LRKLVSVLMLLMCICAANFGAVDTGEVLKVGTESNQVQLIQEVLKAETYYQGEIDGIFGLDTKGAVIAYQRAHELMADGIVGKQTLTHMFELSEEHEHEHEVEERVETSETVVSRGNDGRSVPFGAYLDWWKDIKGKLIVPDDEVMIRDFETGRTFYVVAIAGSNHMDVEALTYDDAQIIQELWGGDYSWARRPVIAYLDGQAVAGSLNGMPHAGRDDKPYKEYVSNRSVGFGYGYNYDKVKGNDFEGVICLHFKNSLLHKNRVKDTKHQAAVRKAAGL